MTRLKCTVFVLAKNEEANIGKCLQSLQQAELPIILLDSGSSDDTLEIASRFPHAETRAFCYTTHADAYNFITAEAVREGEWAIILHADMEISPQLWSE